MRSERDIGIFLLLKKVLYILADGVSIVDLPTPAIGLLRSSQIETPSQAHNFLAFSKIPAERAIMPQPTLKKIKLEYNFIHKQSRFPGNIFA